MLGWHRIPLKSPLKTVAVDWLAFYQTAKFGAEKLAINHAAPVKGHKLTTRAELLRTEPDNPRANDPYFNIQLDPLERRSLWLSPATNGRCVANCTTALRPHCQRSDCHMSEQHEELLTHVNSDSGAFREPADDQP